MTLEFRESGKHTDIDKQTHKQADEWFQVEILNTAGDFYDVVSIDFPTLHNRTVQVEVMRHNYAANQSSHCEQRIERNTRNKQTLQNTSHIRLHVTQIRKKTRSHQQNKKSEYFLFSFSDYL